MTARQVGNEIDHAVFLLPRLHFAAEKIFLPGEPIGKLIGNVENKVRRIVDVHDQRQIVRRGKTHRLAGGAIVMLVLNVERRREKAARLPLQCDRIFVLIAPELRRAAS